MKTSVNNTPKVGKYVSMMEIKSRHYSCLVHALQHLPLQPLSDLRTMFLTPNILFKKQLEE